MKSKITLSLLLLFVTTFAFAQGGNLTIKSETGEKFFLYINGQEINRVPQTAVIVQNLQEPYFDIEIQFANKRHQGIAMGPLTIADGTGQLRHVTYKITKNKRGQMKLNFVSMVPVDRHAVIPRNVFIGIYMPVAIQVPIETDPFPQQPVGCIGGYRMGNTDFQSALATVKNQKFDDTRQKIAQQITSANCLSADQIMQMANIFGFDQSKLDYAKFAYDFCTDPQNYYKLTNIFGFSSSAEELSDYIATKR